MDNKISFWEKVFDSRIYKFLLFLISYLTAVTVLLLVVAIMEGEPLLSAFGAYPMILAFFPFGFLGLPIFFNIDLGDPVGNIGWLIYLALTLCAVFIKNHRIVKNLYFIFVFLLILNILGCVAGNIKQY